MSDINHTILVGRFGKDPELRYTQGGTPVSSFSLASNHTYKSNGEKQEIVSWINCVVWNKLAETIVQYCKKGQRIGVEGRLQTRSWDDQNGNKRYATELIISSFQFLEKAEESNAVNPDAYYPPEDSQQNGQQQSNNSTTGLSEAMAGDNSGLTAGSTPVDLPPGDNPFTDDDIPF